MLSGTACNKPEPAQFLDFLNIVKARDIAHLRQNAGKEILSDSLDVQKVLPTGDRAFIETRAREMCDLFREAGGGWIAKDYPSYGDIGVDPTWARWAQDVIVANSAL